MYAHGKIPRFGARILTARHARGFALPWTMFVLLLVSLLAASGFLITWLEGQSARAFARATEAFYVAEGGLATALAVAEGPNPSVPPVGLGGGTATVAFEPLIDLRPGETVFRVESRGEIVSGGAAFERSVGQLMWVAGPPRLPGALVLLGGVSGPPPEGTISGLDPLGGACPEQPSPVAGVAYWGGPPPAPDSLLTISGSPRTGGFPAACPWRRRRGSAGRSCSPPGVRSPTPPCLPIRGRDRDSAVGGRPSRIPGSAALGAASSGHGALVVEGDLTLDGGFAWNGLILVGGALLLNGDISVRGTLASGLEGGLGVAADFAGHTVDLRFDACAVAAAARRLTAPAAAIPGTWYEVW